MLVERYLRTEVVLERFITDDNDLNAPEYEIAETIKCRIEGGRSYSINGNSTSLLDTILYVTTKKIGVKDLLDGQVVLSVKPIYHFNGSISHYESTVGVG